MENPLPLGQEYMTMEQFEIVEFFLVPGEPLLIDAPSFHDVHYNCRKVRIIKRLLGLKGLTEELIRKVGTFLAVVIQGKVQGVHAFPTLFRGTKQALYFGSNFSPEQKQRFIEDVLVPGRQPYLSPMQLSQLAAWLGCWIQQEAIHPISTALHKILDQTAGRPLELNLFFRSLSVALAKSEKAVVELFDLWGTAPPSCKLSLAKHFGGREHIPPQLLPIHLMGKMTYVLLLENELGAAPFRQVTFDLRSDFHTIDSELYDRAPLVWICQE
jgi:hypothetical protein